MSVMKVIENSLVPIYQDEQRRVVNARELHGFLEVGKDFTTWIKGRIDKYGFVDGEDYVVCSPNLGSKEGRGGHNITDYLLTIDTAKEIAMAENSEKGREVRRYFIACEKRLRDMHQAAAYVDQLPKTFAQALRALADAEDQKLALESKIEEDAPKVAFADAVSASPSTILIGELAKLLRQNGIVIGPHRLFEWMRQNKYLMKQNKTENIPTQHAMELGLFEIHERVVELPTGVSVVKKTTRVTGTGQQFFIQQFLGSLQRVS